LFTVETPSIGLPSADAILEALECSRERCACHRAVRRGRGDTHCPSHDDADPSFSVTPDEQIGVLVKCHGPCTQSTVIEVLRQRGLWASVTPGRVNVNGSRNGTNRWAYEWTPGKVVAYHKRTDLANGKKRFSWMLADGRASDGDINIPDLPIYRRADVLAASHDTVVLVTEGEKAADALAARGFVATSFGGGAGQSEFGEAIEDFRDRHVVLLPDNDDTGRAYMQTLKRALRGIAASVRTLTIPDLPDKGDAYDFFMAGRLTSELTTLLDAATPEGTQARPPRFEIIDAPDYLDRPATRWQVQKLLPERSFATIVGGPGSYKSFIALNLVACIALGIPFHGFETVQGSCLYIAGEGAGGFAQRMRAWQRHHGQQLPRALKILPAAVPLVDHSAVNDLIEQIQGFNETFAVIVVDTLSRAMAGEDENASAPMTKAVQAAELLQQALGCCVIVIHHGRKSDGEIRGHGSLKGALDTVLLVERDKNRDTVQVEVAKQKDGEEITPFFLRPVVVDVTRPVDLHAVSDEQVTSLAFDRVSAEEAKDQEMERRWNRLTVDQRFMVRALASFGAPGATSRPWMEATRALSDVAIHRQTFHRRVPALVDAGVVMVPTARNGEGIYCVPEQMRRWLDSPQTSRDAMWEL
jgi:hypothetical protein